MPLVVYSLLRLAVLGGCWALLWRAGLHPLLALAAAAVIAWGISYLAMRGPADAAARWLAERDAARKSRGGLSARQRRDADDEDAAADAAQPHDEGALPVGPAPDSSGGEHDEGAPPLGAVPDSSGGARRDGGAPPTGGEPGAAQSASPSPSSTP